MSGDVSRCDGVPMNSLDGSKGRVVSRWLLVGVLNGCTSDGGHI